MKQLSGFIIGRSVLSFLLLSHFSINRVVADEALVKWMLENGGVFSDKVEFRHLDPSDETSPNGLFAKASLKEEETIMVIPQKCLLKSPAEPPEEFCGLARSLVNHYNQGDESFYKAYVDYLFDGNKKGNFPDQWSSEAKGIVKEIVGDELRSPLFGYSFEDHCGGSGDEILEDAYELVVSRSWNEVMVPLLDMVNHRNGRWLNVESTSAHTGEDITVYAFRDIEAGEQLFNTYTNCLDIDCQGLFYTYGTLNLLGDYGFVEDYPQKWIWEDLSSLRYGNSQPLVLELDQVKAPDPYDPPNHSEQFQVTWHTDARPDLQMVNVLSGHLKVLEKLEGFVQKSSEALASNHERYTIRKLYTSLLLALQYTIWSYYEEAVDELANPNKGRDHGDVSNIRHYDSLESRPVIGNPEDSFLYVCHPSHERIGPGYESVFTVESQHQKIEFTYGEEEDDTCLWLSGWGQTCSSFRQYHEALVHYPASFVPQIKRVAYIGGGDNMILHEILKYSSIELVLGLELDQDVVRYSFMNLGTLPYFDDPRVQWWFGDATKSLSMLPQDYFGSFDLVLVDLQNFVADALYVTEKLSLMDTMKLLLKPNGIISKNEDFPNRFITDFARYTVDMEYCDLPQICRQSITLGSNGINFLTAPQFKHDIQTIYMNESLQAHGRFNNWYNFRENHVKPKSATPLAATEGSDDSAPSLPKKSHGVLVVIEAEKLSRPVRTKEAFVEAATKALEVNGIEVLNVHDWVENESHFDVVLIFRQGYLSLRKRPGANNYVAMDLELWDDIAKVNLLKKALIESIGGDEKKTSSFRLVTGGIPGLYGYPYLTNYVAPAYESRDPKLSREDLSSKELSLIWGQFVKLIPVEEKASIVVLCGSKDSTCAGWDALKKTASIDVAALYACEGISEESDDETQLFLCEKEAAKELRSTLPNKINGIWLDTTASQTTARVLLRLLMSQIGRADFLDNHNYTVMAQLTGEEWQEIFLERFRTEVSPIDPAKEAIISFSDEKTFRFFSAGDERFYSSIVRLIEDFTTNTQLTPTLDTVVSGHFAYIPNFSPKFFNNQVYDNSVAYSQWNSQKPTGYQIISQLDLKAPKLPLNVGETVLYQSYAHVWVGVWTEATIVRQNEDLTYDIKSTKVGDKTSVSRDSLRRLDFHVTATQPIPTIDIGARVIYHRELEGELWWLQGFIVSRSEDGRTYGVRQYDVDGALLEMDARDLMPEYESADAGKLPELSMPMLETILEGTLSNVAGGGIFEPIEPKSHEVGDGCVITAFWEGGDVVLVWGGASNIDINLFLDDEDEEFADAFHNMLMDKIPFLTSIIRDEHPRGYGGVVNFGREIDLFEDPIWRPVAVNGDEEDDEDEDEEDEDEEDEEDDEDEDEDDEESEDENEDDEEEDEEDDHEL